jgi:type IV conjugative transfer system coupling protein TraD
MARNNRSDTSQSKRVAPLNHHSGGGDVRRNTGNFTRGSQLIGHRLFMWKSGALIPVYIWFALFALGLWISNYRTLGPNDLQLIFMRIGAWFNSFVGLNELRMINLTVERGDIRSVPIGSVAFVPEVALAWGKAVRCFFGSLGFSLALSVPLSTLFVRVAKSEGSAALSEHHERGSRLVNSEELAIEIDSHNNAKFVEQAAIIFPEMRADEVLALLYAERKAAGIHHPYSLADIPYPYGLEASHTMLIGTTGTGKSTVFKDTIKQIRERGHSAIIFDVTGSYVEHFYDPERDIILNPNDERCPAWTLFGECSSYADFHSAALALIPSGEGGGDPFWAEAARSLFVEMAVRLTERGLTRNADLVDQLMKAKLKSINRMLTGTIAQPMTEAEVSKTALSIRMVFNAHATIFRFLKDDGDAFSIKKWMTGARKEGGLLFINSSYNDLSMTRTIITLWMDIAISALMTLPKTRQVNTWFLFDELGALHKLPAIENGLQTARQFGGAFMLGVHSFAGLEQVYGEDGARNIISLARTKLILATSDAATAEEAAKLIGTREVRKVEETTSYGYNNQRDASTLTADRRVETLILASDLADERSLSGFLKFPEGFPAARIKLSVRDYPIVAKDVIRRNDEIIPVSFGDGLDDDEEVDEDGVVTGPGGRENEDASIAKGASDAEIGETIENPESEPGETQQAVISEVGHLGMATHQSVSGQNDLITGMPNASESTEEGQQGAHVPKEAPIAPTALYEALAVPTGENGVSVKAPTSMATKQAIIAHATDFGEPESLSERDDHERG